MRLTRLQVRGVGGLADTDLLLPTTPVAAFAGANGTGKSKLLACLLSPWTGTIPAPGGAEARVDVHITLTSHERDVLDRFAQAQGWNPGSVPQELVSVVGVGPFGIGVSDPQNNTQHFVNFIRQPNLLAACSSLDVLYLPAERRLVPSGGGIDLNQLSTALEMSVSASARNAVQSYGRLDDGEFEQFARALFVADLLPEDPDDATPVERARIDWATFSGTVNAIIEPKRLIPPTRQRPETLLIETPGGLRHPVQDLSSGERQALIIVSRMLRAGTGRSVALIDEPDAYLHPTLSRRLAVALEGAVGETGQLIMASHSPATLDSVTPASIIRLAHGQAPRPVADETERLDVYREVGFRASVLTQADLLVVSEGRTEEILLPLLLPDLGRVSLRGAGGRANVIADVTRLLPLDLPVLGLVDHDVLPEPLPTELVNAVHVWDVADLEAVFLSDDAALEVMVDRGLAKAGSTVLSLRNDLNGFLVELRDNTIAEIAQRNLRSGQGLRWPSSRGRGPLELLRTRVGEMTPPSAEDVEEAIAAATAVWDSSTSNLWKIVRGKYVLGRFTDACSSMASGPALLDAIARARPALAAVEPFAVKVRAGLAASQM